MPKSKATSTVLSQHAAAISKFWDNVDKTGDCWVWLGRSHREGNGYGRFIYGGRKYYAHRFAAEFCAGLSIEKLKVCHKCDNPLCVRPEHLFVGTQKHNLDDMVQKGRNVCGEKSPYAILTEENVLAIRGKQYQYWPLGELAAKFGVSPSTICDVQKGRTWKHLL